MKKELQNIIDLFFQIEDYSIWDPKDYVHKMSLKGLFVTEEEERILSGKDRNERKVTFAYFAKQKDDLFITRFIRILKESNNDAATGMENELRKAGFSELIPPNSSQYAPTPGEHVHHPKPKIHAPQQHLKPNNDRKKILVIGSTGNGKSALCNRILTPESRTTNVDVFLESDDATSETKETIGHSGTWNGMNVFVIDTPGMNDSDGVEAKHLIMMIDFLKDQHDIHAIFLVFNTHQDRFDSNIQRLICLLTSIFKSADFWDHVALVFTKNFAAVPVNIEKKRQRYGTFVADIVKTTGLEAITTPKSYFVDSKDFQDVKTKNDLSFLSAWVKSLESIGTQKLQQPDEMYLTNNYTKMREMTEELSLKDQKLKIFTDKAAKEKRANELYYSLRGILDGAGWPGDWGNTDRGSASVRFIFRGRQINADEYKNIGSKFANIKLTDAATGQFSQGSATYTNDGVNSYEVRRSSACRQFIELGFLNEWWGLEAPKKI